MRAILGLAVALVAGGCLQILGFDDPTPYIGRDAAGGAGGSPTTCGDGIKNGNETDIDCGGLCPTPCADGKGCSTGSDCASHVCEHGTCLPAACSDDVKNGDETDIDCGGGCAKCDAGKACAIGNDCKSGLCTASVCASTCTDGAKGGTETDVDCGGAVCPACADGKACLKNDDCESAICKPDVCLSSHIWSEHFGGTSALGATGVAVDLNGNIALAGVLTGTANLGGGQLTSGGKSDALVARFNSAGKHLWSNRFGDANDQRATGIAVDINGNALVAGEFGGVVDFGKGPLTSVSASDIFVAAFTPSGVLQWSSRYGGAQFQRANAIAADKLGNSFLVGMFSGSITFGGNTLSAASNTNAYLAKLSAAGHPVWSKQFGDSNGARATDVTTDSSGNVIITGAYEGTVNLGGATFSEAGSAFGATDIFVAKFDTAGNHIWSTAFGSEWAEVGLSVASDPNGNTFVAGTFRYTLDFGDLPLTSIGGYDIFIIKLDTSGQLLWSRRFGGPLDEQEPRIAVDELGDVYLTAGFRGTIDLGGGKSLASAGDYDVMVVKFDSTGNRLWSKRFGDAQPQAAAGIAAAGMKQVLVVGSFKGTINFGGPSDQLIASGPNDIYLARLLTP